MKQLEWRDEAPPDARHDDENGVELRSRRLTRVATPPTPQPEEVEVEEQVEDVSSDEDVQDGALRCGERRARSCRKDGERIRSRHVRCPAGARSRGTIR